MVKYLLDTNHASRLMDLAEPITARARQARARGDQLGLSITVVAELHYAVYASRQQARNAQRLREMIANYSVWPFDELAAEEFGRIRAEQRNSGRPIPSPDAQIAAVARIHGLIVLTADHHFMFVAGLTVENWLI